MTIVASYFFIRCHVAGKPDPQTTWLRNGVRIEGGLDRINLRVGDGGQQVLRLRKPGREDDGARFTLQASNALGSVETSARLTVVKPKDVKKKSKPAFYVPLRNL